MIVSAIDFIRMCSSNDPDEVNQTLWDEAPIDVWKEIIVRHPDKCIDVAQNRTIQDDIIKMLSLCADVNVRTLIAEKGNSPIDVLTSLSKDADERVRRKVAANRKTPIGILEYLVADPVESVSSVASFNIQNRLKVSR